jgi:hypothetical protein
MTRAVTRAAFGRNGGFTVGSWSVDLMAGGGSRADCLDAWQNWESINGQDVVVWYGAHFSHDVQAEPPGSHGHIIGPDLKPVNW